MASDPGKVQEMFRRADEELANAAQALGNASDWLRPDWPPLGASLTDAEAELRNRINELISLAKTEIGLARTEIDASRANLPEAGGTT